MLMINIWPNSQKHDRKVSKIAPTARGPLTVPRAEIGSSRMQVKAPSPAGCHFNTELPNKVQKGTDSQKHGQ